MSSINPTIGRRVWFWTANADQANVRDPRQAFDAGVIFVHNPTTVCLSVIDHSGRHSVEDSVPLRDSQPGDEHGKGERYATWMPYQMQAASKDQAA
jgi:hypothetical protein